VRILAAGTRTEMTASPYNLLIFKEFCLDGLRRSKEDRFRPDLIFWMACRLLLQSTEGIR